MPKVEKNQMAQLPF